MSRVILIVTLILTATANLYAANDPFPVPVTGNDIRDAYLNSERWDGKLIALAGSVLEIKEGNQGKPLIRLSVRKPNDNDTSIWVGSLVRPEAGQIKPGHIIRVLGYLSSIESTDSIVAKTVRDPLFLLGFCLVNQSATTGLFLPSAINQCDEWKNGTIPKNVRK
jgi:hypothetical protein